MGRVAYLDLEAPVAPPRTRKGFLIWGIFGIGLLGLVIIVAATGRSSKPQSQGGPLEPQLATLVSGIDKQLMLGLGQAYLAPNVRKPEARAHFHLGLLLYHVFWFDLSAKHFKQARTLEPTFAMAYWGEALALKQPLWQHEDLAQAQSVLQDMDAQADLVTISGRDRQYIAAIRKLYAINTTLERRERDYSAAMAAAWRSNKDADTCALYGLSLMGMTYSAAGYASGAEGEKFLDQARELLDGCARTWPQHAGIMHYQVHAYDVANLTLAERGMDPGIRLADAANMSCHANHMKSHIFVLFGNWSETEDSNKGAVAASDAYCGSQGLGYGCDMDDLYHALEWWQFALLQQCRFTDAKLRLMRMQDAVRAAQAASDPDALVYMRWLYRMHAAFEMQSELYQGPITIFGDKMTAIATELPPALLLANTKNPYYEPHAEAYMLLAQAYMLTWNTSADEVTDTKVHSYLSLVLARLENMRDMLMTNNSTATAIVDIVRTVHLQASALAQLPTCLGANTSSCMQLLAYMDSAMSLFPTIYDQGPSLKHAPVPQMYGDLILRMHTVSVTSDLQLANGSNVDANVAISMYQMCLEYYPNRMECVLGMARAYALQTNAGAGQATRWYGILLQQCKDTLDTNFPGLVEAKQWQ